MEFALIRHTRCEVAEGTCYGHLDVPLAGSAAADIELTLSRVPPADLVFSSPSRRCHSLAQALAARDRCEMHIRDDLRELSFESWEGLRWADIPRTASNTWSDDPWHNAPPGGESERQLWERVARVADEMLRLAAAQRGESSARDANAGCTAVGSRKISAALNPIAAPPTSDAVAPSPFAVPLARAVGPRIAVVSHGGPLRHLRCMLTGTPASDRWSWSIEFGAVALIAPPESACRSWGL